MKALVEGDPPSAVEELSDTCGLSIGMVHLILHNNLHTKNVAARWVPHLFTDEKKNGGLIVCAIYTNFFLPNGPKRHFDVVTWDETWIIFNGIPNNRWTSAWVGPVGDRPAVSWPGFQTWKRLLTVFFQPKQTVGTSYSSGEDNKHREVLHQSGHPKS